MSAFKLNESPHICSLFFLTKDKPKLYKLIFNTFCHYQPCLNVQSNRYFQIKFVISLSKSVNNLNRQKRFNKKPQ